MLAIFTIFAAIWFQVGKDRDAALEMVADRNNTIEKFREVVQQLQTSNQDLRESLQRETKKPIGAPPEVIDYQKMFTETKTFTKTIDLELRKLDVQQALQHVQYLCTYMPDSFMARGGSYFFYALMFILSFLLYLMQGIIIACKYFCWFQDFSLNATFYQHKLKKSFAQLISGIRQLL